jgi:hypothetical protein
MKSVGVASPLTTQYYRERAKTDWLGIIKEIGQVTARNNGRYPWSFVTQIFHSGQPSHGGDRKTFEVMTSA